jgi:hypothetical protein
MSGALDVEKRRARAEHLKERIYITFAALAVVLALNSHPTEAAKALLTMVVTVLGATLALFVADLISHLVVQERMFDREELRHSASTSFGALSVVFLPVVFLLLALFEVWTTDAALTASAYALIASLVVIGLAATRKVPMTWWQRLIALGAEAALGLAVIGLQVLAKAG